jgi:hypothetical protein
MLEVIKIIILACQVSSGSVVPAVVDRHQKACQKDMIKCVNLYSKEYDERKSYTTLLTERLAKCLEER